MDEKLNELNGMDLQEQVEKLREMLANANERVEQFRQWWMKAEAERDQARNMLKSLKTLMAAIEVEENLFK